MVAATLHEGSFLFSSVFLLLFCFILLITARGLMT